MSKHIEHCPGCQSSNCPSCNKGVPPVERWQQFGGHIASDPVEVRTLNGYEVPDPVQRAATSIHAAHEQRVKENTEKAQAQRLDILILEIKEQDDTEIERRARRVAREIGLEVGIREFEDFQSDLCGGHRIFVQ